MLRFLNYVKETDVALLMESFHSAYLKMDEKERKLLNYDPAEMRMLSDKNSPGLFQKIEQMLSTNRSRGNERRQLKTSPRAVSVLHQFLFLRNEVKFLVLFNSLTTFRGRQLETVLSARNNKIIPVIFQKNTVIKFANWKILDASF